ncbi:unnamed protein product, partial [Cuscuta europaea]
MREATAKSPRQINEAITTVQGNGQKPWNSLFKDNRAPSNGIKLRFKCIDFDGNGILTKNEMQFFYEEHLHRMECMAQE